MTQDKTGEIRKRIEEIRESLKAKEIRNACAQIIGCRSQVSQLKQCMKQLESQLDEVPAIEIAFLGPSRHGKSTLMNELTSLPLLSTSDIKPCTAAVVRMKWDPKWSLTVSFIDRDSLTREWGQAVQDAEEFLSRRESLSYEDEAPDDGRYLISTLQRFIHLFQLDPSEDTRELVNQIKTAKIPGEIAQHLGKQRNPNANSLKHFQGIIKEFLSTEGVYWTIVESCDICGPFEQWHPNLSLVDLPGTNDTDPHRSTITNSLRSGAKAVAILTSDSNLGNDIESWLQNSTVLADFLEAKESRRQRLFIIRTKLDSYLPSIDIDKIDEEDEESEEKLRREALENYKRDQLVAYLGMLKDIVLPMLPAGISGELGKQKRQELLERVTKIPVFFVSSQAHAAFKGRLKATKRDIKHLIEDFSGDLNATGIPDLRDFLNSIADEYLAKNHYEDIEARLESEVGQLAQYFRKESRAVQAQLAGAGESVRSLVIHVQQSVIPWIGNEVIERTSAFVRQASRGNSEIRHRLDQVWAMSERRFQDKMDKWSHYAWNTLRATARKDGSHTRSDGTYIDINQDICSVLVDDLILAWTSYRDYLIDERIDKLTDDFAKKLQIKLREASLQTDNPDAKLAIEEILLQLGGLTNAQRQHLISEINAKIKQFESLRHPAYALVTAKMKPTFERIEKERGDGCQRRMRQILLDGFSNNIDIMRDQIHKLISKSMDDLLGACTISLQGFGKNAADRIGDSVKSIAEMQRLEDEQLLNQRQQLLISATTSLPSSLQQVVQSI